MDLERPLHMQLWFYHAVNKPGYSKALRAVHSEGVLPDEYGLRISAENRTHRQVTRRLNWPVLLK